MGKVRIECFAISVDGYGAGPSQDLEHPLGVGGERLHDWTFASRNFRRMHGLAGGETGLDDDFIARGFEGVGAWILGRNMFGPMRGPWVDDSWRGWWAFVVGNILYNQQLFRNGMRLQAFYELGNGQEAQREFQYIKVTDGQGVYKWTDYNGDGVQQLDEFEIAEYSDLAQYIRVYTNSVRYIPSNKNKLQLALFVNPAIVFNSENGFLKRWNFNISLNSQNSFYKKDKVLVLNPFEKNSDQILKNQNILASVQFNPTDKSGWNGNYRFISNDNLINANFSNEEREQTSHFLNIGYWFNKEFRVDWENSVHDIKNSSQLFGTRDYRLNNFETKPKATYKFTNAIQAELSSAFRQKQRLDGEELLKAFDVTGTIQWERRKTSIRGNFSFISNNFTGNNFSIVGNQMLDGLKPGKNQVWSVFIQQAINSFIQLNLNYEGRNSGDRTIHIGSMQVKASF